MRVDDPWQSRLHDFGHYLRAGTLAAADGGDEVVRLVADRLDQGAAAREPDAEGAERPVEDGQVGLAVAVVVADGGDEIVRGVADLPDDRAAAGQVDAEGAERLVEDGQVG